eukprot:CAMPEP_0172899384 /NCGR_PEP_ID=MMETSP1075-20121228/161689_1 /TAXON_ID=2916 /ORGANISM="Ceratium fusus, Strain PA161109" /LENGTH=39 /DNA_ID= /DNA_START= /DNA_END= /DNA_ORIENTATION=
MTPEEQHRSSLIESLLPAFTRTHSAFSEESYDDDDDDDD